MLPQPPFPAVESVNQDIAGKIFQRSIQFGIAAHRVDHHRFSRVFGGAEKNIEKAALDGQDRSAQTIKPDFPQRVSLMKTPAEGLFGHPEILRQMPGMKFKTPQAPLRLDRRGNQRVRPRTVGVKVKTQTQMLFPDLPSSG